MNVPKELLHAYMAGLKVNLQSAGSDIHATTVGQVVLAMVTEPTQEHKVNFYTQRCPRGIERTIVAATELAGMETLEDARELGLAAE